MKSETHVQNIVLCQQVVTWGWSMAVVQRACMAQDQAWATRTACDKACGRVPVADRGCTHRMDKVRIGVVWWLVSLMLEERFCDV